MDKSHFNVDVDTKHLLTPAICEMRGEGVNRIYGPVTQFVGVLLIRQFVMSSKVSSSPSTLSILGM